MTTTTVQHANTRSLPTIVFRQWSRGHFFLRSQDSGNRRGMAANLGPGLLKGMVGRDGWVINSHFMAQWNQSRKAMAHQAHDNSSLVTPKGSTRRPHYSWREFFVGQPCCSKPNVMMEDNLAGLTASHSPDTTQSLEWPKAQLSSVTCRET